MFELIGMASLLVIASVTSTPGPAGTTPATPSAATVTRQGRRSSEAREAPRAVHAGHAALAGTRTILKLNVLGVPRACLPLRFVRGLAKRQATAVTP